VPELGRLCGHGEAAPRTDVGAAALQGCILEGACDDDGFFDKGQQDAHVTVDVWIIFYVYSGIELKHMEKGE
jgi:hypothetical protein